MINKKKISEQNQSRLAFIHFCLLAAYAPLEYKDKIYI